MLKDPTPDDADEDVSRVGMLRFTDSHRCTGINVQDVSAPVERVHIGYSLG